MIYYRIHVIFTARDRILKIARFDECNSFSLTLVVVVVIAAAAGLFVVTGFGRLVVVVVGSGTTRVPSSGLGGVAGGLAHSG